MTAPTPTPSSDPLCTAFSSSALSIETVSNEPPTSSSILPLGNNLYRTTSFYRDSSGRATLSLRLRLDCQTKEDLGLIVDSGCVVPRPSTEGEERGGDEKEGEKDGDGGGEDKDETAKKTDSNSSSSTLRFEVQSTGGSVSTKSGGSLIVEGVTVLSSSLLDSQDEGRGILFETEVVVRAPPRLRQSLLRTVPSRLSSGGSQTGPRGYGKQRSLSSSSGGSLLGSDVDNAELPDDVSGGGGSVRAQLEIRAVLSQKRTTAATTRGGQPAVLHQGGDPSLSLGLLALELGGRTVAPPPTLDPPRPTGSTAETNKRVSSSYTRHHYGSTLTTLPPSLLTLHLVEPLTLTVREIGGARAAAGATLVSLTIEHSNVHDESVTITNVAIHPGHSRLWSPGPTSQSQVVQPEPSGSSGLSKPSGGVRQRSAPSSPYQDPNAAMVNLNRHRSTGSASGLSGANTSMTTPISSSDGRSMQGGQLSVIDMSRHVRWGYAQGTAPDLPCVLRPHEALATVISIDAGEDLRSRAFVSPVAVTALVGGTAVVQEEEETKGGEEEERLKKRKGGQVVVVATDARWTTARVAVEPADAFRVDMSLRESRCRVGAPLVVSLKVMNLSHETRDLMLLMAKDEEGRSGGGGGGVGVADGGRTSAVGGGMMSPGPGRGSRQSQSQQQQPPPQQQTHGGVNTAVVSEVNGYTFGVWGLSGDDDGTVRHNRDHELLAVDAALLLGEVKGQQFIEAELRFVPLREGTLDVPNLKLYDKMGGRWYNCVHMLKIVAAAN